MSTISPRPTRARLNFTIFALAAVGAGWLGVLLDLGAGAELTSSVATSDSSGTLGLAVFILLPVVTALVLYFVSRDGAGPLGLTLRLRRPVRWFGAAVLLYPLATAIALGVGIATGTADLSTAPAAGKPAFLAAFVAILGFQVIKNLFEEFTFRGYGTRTALAMGLPGRLTPHLLVGVVWALWHLPLYLVWTPAADMRLVTSLPWPLFAPLFIAGLTAAAVVYGEMRARTGSIWPGVVLHSVSNAIVTPLLVNEHLTFTGHGDALASPVPTSIVMIVLFTGVGLLLARRRPVHATEAAPAPAPVAARSAV
jgi:membrane protease YdiL (CAAX protease family)